VLLVFLLALVAAGVTWSARPKKVAVTLEVTGPKGLKLQGTADVDGRAQDLTGTIPARFVLEGSRITYSLANPDDAGEYRVHVSLDGVLVGAAPARPPTTTGVRGWVRCGWGSSPPSHWVESFEREGDPPWRLAPPP
jgi:hypothetical protein